MFAIVDIAGFQEKVQEGDVLHVPTLDAKEGATVTFDQVLLLAKGDDNVTVGQPLVSGVAVTAKVISHGRDAKIRVVKMRRRKRYRRVHGHKQPYTEIEIMKIDVGSPKKGTGRTLQNKE
ncbi:MAG TPA: 50S ribosomal protein L21 [Candidatus Peribacteraceae bacterium]|nr:50S ribosomal protein L21 [Candidatus Peribacteraceae bacterium]